MYTRKKIGIKYCGGCNPNYERVEMIRRVQFLVEDRFTFLYHDHQDLDLLVLVNGCPRACAGKNLNQMKVPYRSITEESNFKNLIDWLTTLDEKGDS